ncbi:MAG: site-2 protease family protein [Anaerolineales bacterium]
MDKFIEMASFDWIELWTLWLWPILLFIFGLGLVIFIHELGHFMVAKFVGIRVEQFALGFGLRVFGFKWGETDYRVNLLPVGGYVRMAGQEDFGPIRKQDAHDPRSFANKPVSARLAVVSAGVVMNALLAAALFVVVCLAGIRFPAPVVGGTLLGSPAENAKVHWLATGREQWKSNPAPRPATSTPRVSIGFKPGDRILDVNGKRITQFAQLEAISVLAEPEQKFRMTVEREEKVGVIKGSTRIGVILRIGINCDLVS